MAEAPPTLADLEAARADLARWQARWDNYDGNNPNKFQADIRRAQAEVERLTAALKASGMLPYTPQEELQRTLDGLAPNARKDVVVRHDGIAYRRRYTPAAKSRTGRVTSWRGYWERLAED